MDDIYRKALDELHGVLVEVDKMQEANALDLIAASQRIALYGVGREGLQIKALPCGSSISVSTRMSSAICRHRISATAIS